MVSPYYERFSRAIGVLVCAISAAACSETSGANGDGGVDSVAVAPAAASLEVGESLQLEARAYDANRALVPDAAFAWSSTRSGVVSVTASGMVRAETEGSATIGATSDGVTGTAAITAQAPGTGPALTVALSSYLGGSQFEQVRDVAMDAAGNAYVVGGTESSDFPVTGGAYQTTANPGTPESGAVDQFDVFVVKLSPAGAVLWSTFLGGPNYDRAYGVEVDAQGYVYVAGRAGAGFPVTGGAFQTAFQGGTETAFYGNQDGFVCKLEPDGSDVVFCSFFGTDDPSIVRDLDIDGGGNIYLASGYTSGSYTAGVAAAFVNAPTGAEDAVLAKISPDGSSVLWARYIGGAGYESRQNSVRVGPDGHVIFVCATESGGIASGSAYDQTYGGNTDVFVTKLEATSGDVQWGSYVGGSGHEAVETHELAVDSAGNVIVAIETNSADLSTSANAFQPTLAGNNDIAVLKLSADGANLLAATYVGGGARDGTQGVGVDRDGNVYFSGVTASSDFPVTGDAYRSMHQGGAQDMVVVSLAPDLTALRYASYLGGSGFDAGRTGMASGNGVFWVAGETNSMNWEVVNGVQTMFGGGNADGVLVKFVP